MAVLREIVGHAFGEQNVTGVAAIHHSLRDVDARARDIRALVHIHDFIDRPAVNAHPHLHGRVSLERLGDLQSALRWPFGTVTKHQRHPIARWQPDELAGCVRSPHPFRLAHEIVQLMEHFALLVNEQFRVTNNVDEQDVPDFELQISFSSRGHPTLLLLRVFRRE